MVSDTIWRRRPIYFYISSKSFSLFFLKKNKNIDKLVYAPISVFIPALLLLFPVFVFYSLTLIHLFMLEFSCTERSLDVLYFFYLLISFQLFLQE